MKKIIIALDDGHGDFGVTAGKRTPVFPAGHKYAGQIMYENNFNKDVVAKIATHLERCGFDILFTAPTDADTPLATRTNLANNKIKNKYNKQADILISVHANALTGTWGSQNGIETLWTKRSDEKLAKVIHKHIIGGTKLNNRGCKAQNLHMTREATMPACLVEAAFMDNLKEAELLMSQEYREECALEISKGVCEYFGVDSKPIENNNIEKDKVVKIMSKYFKDVAETHWASKHADKLFEKKVLNGKKDEDGDIILDGSSNISRYETVVLVSNAIDYVLEQLKK